MSSIFQAFNSRSGAVYHIGYPAVSRSVLGVYGACYAAFARAILALVYYAIERKSEQSRNWRRVYQLMLPSFSVHRIQFHCEHAHGSLWSLLTNILNQIPESVGFTTQKMVAFRLIWFLRVPFTLLRPNQLFWVFTLKMCTTPPAYVGLFIFCVANTQRPLGSGLPAAQNASKSQFSWFIMYAVNAGFGNTADVITNQPDYARWSWDHWAVIIPQVIANPISVTIRATFASWPLQPSTTLGAWTCGTSGIFYPKP